MIASRPSLSAAQESCGDATCDSSTEFCGGLQSGNPGCFPTDCDGWFQRKKLSGTQATAPVCRSYETGHEDARYAVLFGCGGRFGVQIDEEDGEYGVPFNEYCYAPLGDGVFEDDLFFECYQLKEGTDFSSFVTKATAEPAKACPEQSQTNDESPLVESFIYQTFANTWFRNANFSATFDESSARLTTWATVRSPTEAPSTSPTRFPTESGSARTGGLRSMMAGLLLAIVALII